MKTEHYEVLDYDDVDTSLYIDPVRPLSLHDLGLTLPKEGLTKVVSIRIPTKLLNQIKAYSTDIDMSYQAYLKHLISQGLKKDMAKPIR